MLRSHHLSRWAPAVPVIEYLAAAGLGLDLATLAWALNFGACFGGNATLIGASANIVTATLAERAGEHISFLYWMKGGIPVTLVRGPPALAVTMPGIVKELPCHLPRSSSLLISSLLFPSSRCLQVSVAMADVWMILRFCL